VHWENRVEFNYQNYWQSIDISGLEKGTKYKMRAILFEDGENFSENGVPEVQFKTDDCQKTGWK